MAAMVKVAAMEKMEVMERALPAPRQLQVLQVLQDQSVQLVLLVHQVRKVPSVLLELREHREVELLVRKEQQVPQVHRVQAELQALQEPQVQLVPREQLARRVFQMSLLLLFQISTSAQSRLMVQPTPRILGHLNQTHHIGFIFLFRPLRQLQDSSLVQK
jgi:hypothetical protein